MTITSLQSQSFQFSLVSTASLTVNTGAQASAPAPAANAPDDGKVDDVNADDGEAQDPAALAGVPADAAVGASAVSPVATSVAPIESVPHDGSTARRADALFRALDRDNDGTISAQEFVDGTKDLLKGSRAHGHGRHGGHRGGKVSGDTLVRLFRAVDADRDGQVDASELSTAVDQAATASAAHGHRRHDRATRAGDDKPGSDAAPVTAQAAAAATTTTSAKAIPAVDAAPAPASAPAAAPASSPAGASSGAVSFTSVTTVTITIAIQQYTSISGLSDSSQPPSFALAA
jgi:hypothetical protein